MSDHKLPPSRTADQFQLRLPDGMRERIADEAKKNGRSMNAEIVSRLEGSFFTEGDVGLSSEFIKRAAEAMERIEEKTLRLEAQLDRALGLARARKKAAK